MEHNKKLEILQDIEKIQSQMAQRISDMFIMKLKKLDKQKLNGQLVKNFFNMEGTLSSTVIRDLRENTFLRANGLRDFQDTVTVVEKRQSSESGQQTPNMSIRNA